MTFEQTGIAPKSDDQRYPFALPDSKESPHKFQFPDFQLKEKDFVPIPASIPTELKPLKTPEEAPFDWVGLMEGWESAYDKTNTTWMQGLTHKEIDAALAGNQLNDKERKALETIKENFDDLSKLDGDAMSTLSKSDITLFKILLTNTARDIQFYDKSRQFLSENRRMLDTNKDGKVDWTELNEATTSPDFKEDQLETITYLRERTSNMLHYADVNRTKYGFSLYAGSPVNEKDFAPGGLRSTIDHTQSLAYSYKFADDYRDVAGVATVGVALLASRATQMGFWAKAGTLVGSLTAGGFALKTVGEWQGPIQQDAQDERIKRLMAKVANFNY